MPAKALHVAGRCLARGWSCRKSSADEDLAAVGRPADSELVQEVAGDLNEPRLDQDLVGGRIKILDQLEDLGEEVNVSGDQQGIAALIGDRAHPADQVAHASGGRAAVGGARVVRLATEPGVIAVFFGAPLQLEGGLGSGA